MIRDILIHPDPRLKKPCAQVTEITPDLIALANDMPPPASGWQPRRSASASGCS
jgi:hypothetical protein